MTHRSLLISATSAIALTVWAPRSSGVVSAQGKAPSVSVYVAALKGECAPDRQFTVVNGQTFVGRIMMLPNAPGRRGRTVLRRFVEDPISRRSAEDEFRKNKAFRVVDSPTQADFVFCLCAKYQEFWGASRAKQQTQRQTDRPETARTGTQVSAVFVESYLKTPQDPKALAESAFWKSGDLTTESPDGQSGKTEEKDKGRKAIVVFTDGVDNASYMATWEDVKARVEESGVIVYPVRYNTLEDWIPFLTAPAARPNASVTGGNSDIKEEYERAAQKLKNLAVASGGRYYEVETMSDTKQAFANIAEELRRYYWLGYYPANTARDGKYHKINVVISKPGAAVRARLGYRAPEGDKGQSR